MSTESIFYITLCLILIIQVFAGINLYENRKIQEKLLKLKQMEFDKNKQSASDDIEAVTKVRGKR